MSATDISLEIRSGRDHRRESCNARVLRTVPRGRRWKLLRPAPSAVPQIRRLQHRYERGIP